MSTAGENRRDSLSNDYSRQMGLLDPKTIGKRSISLVGVGATGSHVAVLLAQMGWGNTPDGQGILKVFDHDIVEAHNLSNQIYEPKHIGMPKVVALNDIIKNRFGFEIEIHNEKVVDQKSAQATYVFLLTDTMSSRGEIFDKVLKYSINTEMVVETRMGLDVGRIYAFNPMFRDAVDEWKNTLYSDKDAEVSHCGASQSVACTAIFLSSLAVSRVINHFRDSTMKVPSDKAKMWNELQFSLYPESFYLRRFGQDPVFAV